jgi:hypothetical protein
VSFVIKQSPPPSILLNHLRPKRLPPLEIS